MKIKNIIIFTALTIASATLMSCSNKNLKIQTEPTSAIEMENTTGMISETNSNSDFESIDGLENVEFENPEFDLDLNENRLTVNGNMSWEMKPDLANVKLVIEKNISDENPVKEIEEKVQEKIKFDLETHNRVRVEEKLFEMCDEKSMNDFIISIVDNAREKVTHNSRLFAMSDVDTTKKMF